MYVSEARPFESLRPLTDYLDSLEQVTENPTRDGIIELRTNDAILTARAVLFADMVHLPGIGGRVLEYRPLPISDKVWEWARLALHPHGSDEYRAEYLRLRPRATEDDLEHHRASPAMRHSVARNALNTLGERLALSGAYKAPQIPAAYQAIEGTLNRLGQDEPDMKFASAGLARIRHGLFGSYREIARGDMTCTPLSKREAQANIVAAWSVVGRPYVFPRLVAAILDSRPH